ncbi:hypothetical protein BpHYR1_026154 [Brachionus plicatilis]|uniref:MICOS complex subunit MIC13 n=1 Tax=Brachionus plicatilis TaxID=10195 RepID=A0A3M7T7C9_BRAPC|nr:hypothetical protein BpHYR1_026154 [Brachionus plicatilis]
MPSCAGIWPVGAATGSGAFTVGGIMGMRICGLYPTCIFKIGLSIKILSIKIESILIIFRSKNKVKFLLSMEQIRLQRMLSIAKFGAKLAIVGGAVYVTVNNSVWDKSEYANKAIGKVKEALPETTELLKDLPSKSSLADKWNHGVERIFDSLANTSPNFESVKNKSLYAVKRLLRYLEFTIFYRFWLLSCSRASLNVDPLGMNFTFISFLRSLSICHIIIIYVGRIKKTKLFFPPLSSFSYTGPNYYDPFNGLKQNWQN